jgi:predicted O-linked N-acetylglucosamine transferase (SPINDLY family)/ADP-heptose:LPS heptosyltransferase
MNSTGSQFVKSRISKSELNNLIPPEIKNDGFYRAIQKITEDEKINNVLEIGSSAGEGSTEAFVRGMRSNPNKPKLFCIEISKPRFFKLKKQYKKDSFVKCYNVSSVSIDEFSSPTEVTQFYHTFNTNLNLYPLERVLDWLRQDIEYAKHSGVSSSGIQLIKKENNINNFDVVLIDGSEFTGQAELDEVYGAQIIMLDDINGFKNYHNYERLKNDPNYSLMFEDKSLRNGYAVFKISEDFPIHFFTIVLNGEPFIRYHIDVFKKLSFKWHWHLIEGLADLKHDTSWCAQSGGRITDDIHKDGLSNDGTSDYLDELAVQFPENITVYRKPSNIYWEGKLEMINAPLKNIKEECLLWQIDCDEIWTVEQLYGARTLFLTHPVKTAAYYYCNYFVGENHIITTRDTYGNNSSYEWLRSWRFKPGFRWLSHEPPRLCRELQDGRFIDIATIDPLRHNETEAQNLVFQHYAYVTEGQLRFKELYYGYGDAVEKWKRLQTEKQFPVFLRDYFPWVKDGAQVNTIQAAGVEPALPPDFFSPHNRAKNIGSDIKPEEIISLSKSSKSIKLPIKSDQKASHKYSGERKDHAKKILVVSHERSGTHFLINTIAFNFPYFSNSEISIDPSLDDLSNFFSDYYLKKESRIFKSHHQFFFFSQFFNELIRNFHIFYIVRDGRDVLTSLFHYYNKHPKSFSFGQSNRIREFFRTVPSNEYCLRRASNVIERWANHVESWLTVRDHITIIRYEDLKHNFDDTVRQIESVLEIRAAEQITLPSLKDRNISPRKGVVGDWAEYFHDSDLNTFNTVAGDLMQELGYYESREDLPLPFKCKTNPWQPLRIELKEKNPNSILWVRTDSIGDAILSASMLPYIKGEFRKSQLTVLCRENVAEIYEACPYVDNIIAFNRKRAYRDNEYRTSIIHKLKEVKAEIALNSVYSRGTLNDLFAIGNGAEERIGFIGNLNNISEDIRNKHNKLYSKLFHSEGEHKLELERHRSFLKGLGIDVPILKPVLWTKEEDEQFADNFFRENKLAPEKTVVLFAGVQDKIRIYEQYGIALSLICKEKKLNVISLGASQDFAINQLNLDMVEKPFFNLSGNTTILQSAAIIKRCRLAIGAETGLAHISCAVGTPNVILLGGGHFGRFMPYSPLTSIVCHPMECYGCSWQCQHNSPYCIKSISPALLERAVRHTLRESSNKSRIFLQDPFLSYDEKKQSPASLIDPYLDNNNVEIIYGGTIPSNAKSNLAVDSIPSNIPTLSTQQKAFSKQTLNRFENQPVDFINEVIDKPAKAIEEIRQLREKIFFSWLNVPSNKIKEFYTGEHGNIHRRLLKSNIGEYPLSPKELQLAKMIVTEKQQSGNSFQQLNYLLAGMLYFPPHRLPMEVDIEKLPAWFQEDFWNFLIKFPALFHEPKEVKHYYRYFNSIVETLYQKIRQNPSSRIWQRLALIFIQRANLIPLYFSNKNLININRKRAEIAEIALNLCGFETDFLIPPHPPEMDKIRVGIYANSIAPYTEIFATLPIFKHLKHDEFEIFLYVRQSDDNPLERYAKQLVNRFTVLPENIKTGCDFIRSDNLDVLFFANNITAISNEAYILANHRMARKQIVHFCQPTTTGIKHIDHFLIGDKIHESEMAANQYSEKLVTLEGSGLCFDLPDRPSETNLQIHRERLGIQKSATMFISGANFFKIIPELRHIWAKIISKVPDSKLVLYPFGPAWSNSYPKNMFIHAVEDVFLKYHISKDRLIVLEPLPSRDDIISLLRCADVYLDAVPYSGATSLLDPLEAGVPPVVVQGDKLRFNQGAAILKDLGVHELVAKSETEYIDLALTLAHDKALRHRVSLEILTKMQDQPRFLNPKSYAKEISSVLKNIVQSDPKFHGTSFQSITSSADKDLLPMLT